MSQIEQINEIRSIDLLRNKLVNTTIVSLSVLAIPTLVSSFIEVKTLGWSFSVFTYIACVVILFFSLFYRKRLSFKIKSRTLIALLFIIATQIVIFYGILGTGLLSYMMAVVLATLFFGVKRGILVLAASILSLSIIGVLIINKIILVKIDFILYSTNSFAWINYILVFLLFCSVIIFTGGEIYKTITRTIRVLNIHNSELEKANERAQVAHRAKSQFLANISHEVRTPLNAIDANSDLLLNVLNDLNHKYYVKSIKTSSANLLTHINRILDLSAIENGKFIASYEFINTEESINNLVEIYKTKAIEKGIDFVCELSELFPNYFYNDKARINSVLSNLLDNAVKFTERGYIKITLDARPTKNIDVLDLIITIKDTGKGISLDFLNQPDKDFSQESGKTTRNYEGVGIGMSLSNKLIEELHGSITFQSKINVGTTITILLPKIKSQYAARLVSLPALNEEQDGLKGPFAYQFSEIEKKNLATILEKLENEIYQQWLKLKQKQSINQIKSFASAIISLAEEYQNQFITNYGLEIKNAVDNFEIDEIQKLLNKYHQIIEYCRDAVPYMK